MAGGAEKMLFTLANYWRDFAPSETPPALRAPRAGNSPRRQPRHAPPRYLTTRVDGRHYELPRASRRRHTAVDADAASATG